MSQTNQTKPPKTLRLQFALELDLVRQLNGCEPILAVQFALARMLDDRTEMYLNHDPTAPPNVVFQFPDGSSYISYLT